MTNMIGENSAAVIVDMQNDFLSMDGALRVNGMPEELKLIGSPADLSVQIREFIDYFMDYGKMYFTTEDHHPERHIEFEIFPPHCVAGTWGAHYYNSLLQTYYKAKDNLVKGQQDHIVSYSVATSIEFPDHIRFLRTNDIKQIFIVGVAYNFCVGESAIAYACQGFDTYVVRDLTLSVPEVSCQDMDEKLDLYGVNLIAANSNVKL